MQYIRQWKVGDKVFASKAEAQRYDAGMKLGKFVTVEDMIAGADELITLLKPFATPRTRKPKITNGTTKGKGKTKPGEVASSVYA